MMFINKVKGNPMFHPFPLRLLIMYVLVTVSGFAAGPAPFRVQLYCTGVNEAVYTPAQEVTIRIGLAPGQYDQGKSVFEVRVCDIDDKIVYVATETADGLVPEKELRIPPLPPGFYRVTAKMKNDRGGMGELLRSFAVIPERTAVPNDINRFGVNFHLTRVPLEEARREVALARRIGLGWGRGMIPDWGDFPMPVQGGYDAGFTRWNDLFTLVERSGLAVVGGLHYTPQWASGWTGDDDHMAWSRILPDDLAVTTGFCEQYAAKCQSFVTYWEVGNEVDAELFFKGRAANYKKGDETGIIHDYVAWLEAAGKGLKTGDPKAKILFAGLTVEAPLGAVYQPFLETAMKRGAASFFDIMNVHYTASLKNVRSVLQPYGCGDAPIWVTEIGGGSHPMAHSLQGERQQLRDDMIMASSQLFEGASKVFKYDFRDDGVRLDEMEDNFGLVYRDFTPKPSYVGYATMVNVLADAVPSKELNLLSTCDQGWVQGYCFTSPRFLNTVNVIWLNDAKKATLCLSSASPLRIIDSMGKERSCAASDRINVPIDDLPLFIIGKIADDPGPPLYPVLRETRSMVLPLSDPGFENGHKNVGLTSLSADEMEFDASVKQGGRQSLKITVKKPSKEWRCVSKQYLCKGNFPITNANQQWKLSARASVKMEGVNGRGTEIVCSFHQFSQKAGMGDGTPATRLSWADAEGGMKTGTKDWTRRRTPQKELPPNADSVTVDFYLSPGTTGTMWVDDMELTAHLFEKPLNKMAVKEVKKEKP